MIRNAIIVLAGLGLLACEGRGDGVRFPGDTVGVVRPRALDDLASVVGQLNAIVVADLQDVTTEFDRCEGPRTVLHLARLTSLLGAAHPDTLSLRVFGGQVPGGRYAYMSESPRYLVGHRYLLFLFNTDWRFSPVIANHAYRVESVAGQDILVSPGGQGVTGVSQRDVETRTRLLYVPEGAPGIGSIRLTPPSTASIVSCGTNPDGSPRCPTLRIDTATPSEEFPVVPPYIPAPPNREEVVSLLTPAQLVQKIDSAAHSLRLRPGGYFASRSRLECWDAVPTREYRP